MIRFFSPPSRNKNNFSKLEEEAIIKKNLPLPNAKKEDFFQNLNRGRGRRNHGDFGHGGAEVQPTMAGLPPVSRVLVPEPEGGGGLCRRHPGL